MPISLRTHRAKLFEYHDAGSEGSVDSTYLQIDSAASDFRWWCSRISPTGREVTTGMQPDHRVDAVFVFARTSPVAVDNAIECDGESFLIRAVLTRDYGHDEVEVYAERVAELELATS